VRQKEEEETWEAIQIQHVGLKKESECAQLKTIDSEGNFGNEANMKGGR
jgi:hypothetical protein